MTVLVISLSVLAVGIWFFHPYCQPLLRRRRFAGTLKEIRSLKEIPEPIIDPRKSSQ